jgi:hypothetical protein
MEKLKKGFCGQCVSNSARKILADAAPCRPRWRASVAAAPFGAGCGRKQPPDKIGGVGIHAVFFADLAGSTSLNPGGMDSRAVSVPLHGSFTNSRHPSAEA